MLKPEQQIEHIQTGFRLIREEYGVSQKVVAEDNSIAQSTLSRVENGHRRPNLKTVLKLLQYYGVTLKEVHERGLDYLLNANNW